MATPKPPTVPLSSWPEQPPGGWTIEAIREAIADYERGALARASRLERALLRDARYRQAVRQALDTVLSLPLEVLANERHGSIPLARRLAEGAAEMLRSLFADNCERWLMRRGETLNIGLAQIEWDTTVVPWRPVKLHEWPLEATRYDAYERRLYAQTYGGGEVEIVPGDGRWVVYDPEGWLRWEGLISCLAEPWAARTMARRNVSNRGARSQVAVISAELPDDTDTDSPQAIEWKTQLKAAQSGAAAGLIRPRGWPAPDTLDLGKSDPTDIFSLDLTTNATDMIVAWLGQDGTATNEGGSLAKAKVLGGVHYDLVERRARTFYGALGPDGTREWGCVTSQIVRPWVLFQEGGSDDVVPLVRRVVPDLEEDARLEADSKRATSFYAEVGLMRMAGYELTAAIVESLAKLRGVRMPEGAVWTAPAPTPPKPAPQGGPPQQGEPQP